MAFLFKSKKNQDRALGGRDPNGSQGSVHSPDARARVKTDEKASIQRSTPTGSLNSLDNEGRNASPDQQAFGPPRRAQTGDPPATQPAVTDVQQLRNGGPVAAPPAAANSTSSLYPWSQRRLSYTTSHPSPFPRYGAAVNAVSSKEGDVYVMGGLINSSTVKGDLWLIEAGGNMSCYPLATTAEGPGPRVGHSSLLVGNAFIVYGGDTKIDESDVLDETLYLLNTSTRQWSRALPAGPRPSGRYGHSLNILGSKIYIFGGQVEGYFMNDLAAFDLNQLQMPNNRWEMLIPNSDSGGPAVGKTPPARTNHSVVTFNDKMYLFGGTNGYSWFNDVWCYDPVTNLWTQLDCIGYIPAPREGHAASLVDDVMYIFGGRMEDGADLGDLAAFRITARRWYTFQNMGPSPSPRSGHSMTTVGKSVVVVGGEPSSATTAVTDLALVYMLDTTKIRYPNDAQVQAQSQRIQGARRPSNAEPPSNIVTRNLSSRDGSQGPPEQKRLVGTREGGPLTNGRGLNGMENGVASNPPGAGTKLPRVAEATSPPRGPPPQGQPPRPTVNTSSSRQGRNTSLERNDLAAGSPAVNSRNQSPIVQQKENEPIVAVANGRRTPTTGTTRSTSATRDAVAAETPRAVRNTRQTRGQGSVDSITEPTSQRTVAPAAATQAPAPAPAQVQAPAPAPAPAPTPTNTPPTALAPAPALASAPSPAPAAPVPVRPSSPPPPTRQPSNPSSRRASNRNSQTVVLLKELDSARNRNAWYASELELARKSGYTPNTSLSPVLDSRAAETFDDDDRPLIEALLAMRSELANVQSSVDKQAVLAAKQIAEAEKQRDAAIQEAVYAKARLAAHMGSASNSPHPDNDRDISDRSNETSRRLATALNAQKELQSSLDRVSAEVEAERRARQLADDTANASQKRMADLESYKQQTSSELERLKAELHNIRREAREQSVAAYEAQAAMKLLQADKSKFEGQYYDAVGSSRDHSDTMSSLREAIAASAAMKSMLESKLDEERALRENVQTKLSNLKAEYEARTAELVTATARLRDAEELAEQHANEARTHQHALLAGLDKITTRDSSPSINADKEHMMALQSQVEAANALVKRYQLEAETASDRLRAAEERIAGLEVYQDQESREGITIRRQLKTALKDVQGLQAANSDLKHQLANQQLETNAMSVQHNTLKNILLERGISPTSAAARSRSITSPRDGSPEQSRLRDLEKQLATAVAAHEGTKQTFASQSQEAGSAYDKKISQLENDYQSAVHYVKGTEKMLKRLKEELARYKSDNARLKEEIVELEDKQASGGVAAPSDWESERQQLQKKIEALQAELGATSAEMQAQLQDVRQQLADTKRAHDETSRDTQASRKDLEQLRQENVLLEQRAHEAEQKVSLLLDQVETSVDAYRKGRGASIGSADQLAGANKRFSAASAGANGGSPGHARQESSEAESIYGGLSGDPSRNSAALENLANELDTLRNKWEATNQNYRLSTAFDFEAPGSSKRSEKDEDDPGLSDQLENWRKRLDS